VLLPAMAACVVGLAGIASHPSVEALLAPEPSPLEVALDGGPVGSGLDYPYLPYEQAAPGRPEAPRSAETEAGGPRIAQTELAQTEIVRADVAETGTEAAETVAALTPEGTRLGWTGHVVAPNAAMGDAPHAATADGRAAGAEAAATGQEATEPAEDPAEIVEAEDGDEADVRRKVVEVGRGDTLLGLLVTAAVPRDDAVQAIEALRRVYNPRSLKVGQEIAVLFEQSDGRNKFMGITIEPNVQRTVTVSRGDGDDYEAVAVDRPLEVRTAAGGGDIRSSLFEAGVRDGVPIAVLSEMIKLFSYDVDFQRDIQPGDSFRVLFERHVTDEGAAVREGDILFAELTLSGKTLQLYRFKTRDGTIDFFNRKGESIRKALLRTPIDGARLTSSFGMRHHPILGYSKMHAGVDFAAPTGTPIFAAGAGVVEEIGGKGAYGNYVRIRHNKDISTAYAHLSRFAPGVSRGDRVRQGQVVGFVGTTGRSTGPHLHYEVLKAGRQVNPLSVDLPTGQQLEGKDMIAFGKAIEGMERQYAQARTKSDPLVAETVSQKGPLPARKPTLAETACTAGC
jgi:murein DD-endopeptidase MepM/ murein hydrolase activator NlpD